MSDDVRKVARQVKAEPLLEDYWLWLNTLDSVPGSKLAEAVTYALNQKPYLAALLSCGETDISNIFAENAIRPFAVGRKTGCFLSGCFLLRQMYVFLAYRVKYLFPNCPHFISGEYFSDIHIPSFSQINPDFFFMPSFTETRT